MQITTINEDAFVLLNFTQQCAESPFWDAATHSFWWVDINAGKIHNWTLGGENIRSWQLNEQVGCLVQTSNGKFLAACESGVFQFDPNNPAQLTEKRCDITHPAANMRFNDGRCDRRGRLWVSSFLAGATEPMGEWFCYDKQGLSRPHPGKSLTPNGLAFSPDNRTMYRSDSHPNVRKVWAYDYDLDDGVVGEARLFLDMADAPGRPDGAAIDTDGCYWIAAIDGGCILRFTPQGKLDRMVKVPMRYPTMCAFGGPDMKHLFVTSLQRADPAQHDEHGGKVVCFELGVQGLAETPFQI